MSECFLVVIPADPQTELPDTADAVCAALARIAGTKDARVKDYGKLQFIDCGSNFQRVGCPACNSNFTREQWHEWMDTDWHGEDGFHLHDHTAPCCGTAITVNDLVYDFPQGFARWFIGARDLNHGQLNDDELKGLEDIAGIRLKAIYQTY